MGTIQQWLSRSKIATGKSAEDLALGYLEKRGLQLITRNFRMPGGEIDLIMRQKSTLVFVEVRYRSHTDWLSPEETINYSKRSRLIKTASFYLQKHPHPWYDQTRFDVVAISQPQKINWIINAFDLDSHENSF